MAMGSNDMAPSLTGRDGDLFRGHGGKEIIPRAATNDDLYIIYGTALYFSHEMARPFRQWNKRYTTIFEVRFKSRRDHAAFPGPPVDRLDRAGPATLLRFRVGDPVEDFVGHGVIGLARIAPASGH